MNKEIRVTPSSRGGRKISSPSSQRDVLHTSTKAEAISKAQSIANNRQSDIVVTGRDGRIREKNSYGSDPFPPRDKR